MKHIIKQISACKPAIIFMIFLLWAGCSFDMSESDYTFTETGDSDGGGSYACTPGDYICVGSELRKCLDDGSLSNTPIQNCRDLNPEQVCVNGGCVVKVCEPNTTNCIDEQTLGTCNNKGNEYESQFTCDTGKSCQVINSTTAACR